MLLVNSKHQSYLAKLKINVITVTKVNCNRQAAQELNADEKYIRDWQKQEKMARQKQT